VPALFAVFVTLVVILATPSHLMGARPSWGPFLSEFARAAVINAGLASAFTVPIAAPAWLALRWLHAERWGYYAVLGALVGGLFGWQLAGTESEANSNLLRAIMVCGGSGLLMALGFWRIVRVPAEPSLDPPRIGFGAGTILLGLAMLYPVYEYLGFIARAAGDLAD
jgi:hypothetical protein